MGSVAALRRGTWVDNTANVISVLGYSVPSFVIATLLSYYVGVIWGILPTGLWGSFQHTILPTLSLSFLVIATIARYIRTEMLEVLGQDYMKTAKAKGLSRTASIASCPAQCVDSGGDGDGTLGDRIDHRFLGGGADLRRAGHGLDVCGIHSGEGLYGHYGGYHLLQRLVDHQYFPDRYTVWGDRSPDPYFGSEGVIGMETTKNLTPDLFEPAETDVKEQEQIAREKTHLLGGCLAPVSFQ